MWHRNQIEMKYLIEVAWMALIPFEDLERANKRYLSELVRKDYKSKQARVDDDSAPDRISFVYKPRSAEQWELRIRQRRREGIRRAKTTAKERS